jgi:hypothetical protein
MVVIAAQDYGYIQGTFQNAKKSVPCSPVQYIEKCVTLFSYVCVKSGTVPALLFSTPV